jgi:hypothetical protein
VYGSDVVQLLKVALRPRRWAQIFLIAGCVVIPAALFVSRGQYSLALIVGLGVILINILCLHSLTRRTGRLEQEVKSHSQRLISVIDTTAELEGYTRTAEQNINALNSTVEEFSAQLRELDKRVPKLTLRKSARKPKLKKTFFLHIPRCSGGTIWSALHEIYGDHNVFIAGKKSDFEDLLGMSVGRRRSYSAIGGHESLTFFRKMLGKMDGYYKIVTLRDPIDRLISEYNFAVAQNEINIEESPFDEYVRYYPINVQITALTGKTDDLSGALNLLNGFFDDFALFDEVDQLLSRLSKRLGTPIQNFPAENRGVYTITRADIPEKTLQFLRDRNELDLRLLDSLAHPSPLET